MTRFARARGCKASNEKLPDDATPWSEIKQQLECMQMQHETDKHRTQAERMRVANYDRFLKEQESEQLAKSKWADMDLDAKPNAEGRRRPKEKKKNRGGRQELGERDNTSKISTPNTMLDPTPAGGRSSAASPTTESNNKSEPLELPQLKSSKKQKTLKQKIDQANTRELTAKEVQSNPQSIKKNSNKNAEEKKTLVKVKKPVEEMTVKERERYERLLAKRRKKGVKRKLKKSEKASDSAERPKEAMRTKQSPEYKRRKPQENTMKIVLNGKEIELVYFDGYPIKKEDAQRLQQLKKAMISKGLPRTEVAIAMKLERRRAEKALAREKKNVCFKCRRAGHFLSECPLLDDASNAETTDCGICFKCGSTEHTSFVCKVVKGNEFRFASCFICKEQGHISWQCPDNAKGLYPKGGACNACGSVTHLKKDCPQHIAKKEENIVCLDTMRNDTKPDRFDEVSNSEVKCVPARAHKLIKF